MAIIRPPKHKTFMKMAIALSEQATCLRREVGCILIDSRQHIIGSGYNGTAYGLAHCINEPCAGATLMSGSGLDICEAIHAEQNALMQCANVNAIETAYVTTAPCIHCVKMLLNTTCHSIIFYEIYPQAPASQALWESAHRLWIQL
jgi:dCMP deaminase